MRTGGVCRLRKGVSRTHAGAACSGPEDARRERSMTASEEKFTRQRLLEVQTLTPNLFTLRTSRDPGFRFTAGQFARLGVRKPSGCIVWRAYRSEEHTSELQSLMRISYAVFCLKKKKP